MPQRQQSANLISGSRLMTNDSRIQNAVLRNGTLWTTHTVMLSTVPQPAGTDVGGAGNPANPDNHSGVQWWEIDPTIETGLSQLPLQRARIEDPTADNCHNGTGGTVADSPLQRIGCQPARRVLRLPEHQRQPERGRADRLHEVLGPNLCRAPAT